MSHRNDQAAPQHTDRIRTACDGSLPMRGDGVICSRRSALKAMLSMAGAAALLGSPVSAFAVDEEPQASQETLDALSDAQAEYDAVKAQLDEISSQYQELSRQLDETMGQIEDVQAQIDETEAEIEAKQAELEEKQQALAERVAEDYKDGGSTTLALLLSSATLDELISNAYYLGKMNESDRRAITEIHDIQQELAQRKEDLEAQKAELEALKEQQAEQLAEMQAKQQEVQETLSGLGSEVQELIAQRDAEIAEAIAEAEAEEQRRREEEEARRRAEQQQQQSGGVPNLPAAGSGQDYSAASAGQKRIVDSCYYTPCPGPNYCAKWVSWVFNNAGYGRVYGNANDMYSSWCTSSSKDSLQVGMIIAVSTHSHTIAGSIWGHVGIYIGDNKVMQNIGYINTQDLDSWIRYYGTTVTPRWGWANGIDLSAQ